MDKPDVAQLRGQTFPQAAFPGGDRQPFRIFIAPDVHARILQHAREQIGVEICGVLVGVWQQDADGPFLTINEAIRGEAATNKFAEVTFTHETWARIHHEMDTRFADRAIVGWYHSHPDFGVFLSDRDLFIQQHFFSGAGQVALVVDPVRGTEGVFIWKDGKSVLAPLYWVGGTPFRGEQAAAEPEPKAEQARPAPARPTSLASFFVLSDSMRTILVIIGIFMVGYFLGGRVSDIQLERLRQDMLARAALTLGVKPGLNEALERTAIDLEKASREAAALLAAEAPADEEKAQERKEKTRAVRGDLVVALRRLRALQAEYGMTSAETEQLVARVALMLASVQPGLTRSEREKLQVKLEKLLIEDLKEGRIRMPPTDGANGKEQPEKKEPGDSKSTPKKSDGDKQ